MNANSTKENMMSSRNQYIMNKYYNIKSNSQHSKEQNSENNIKTLASQQQIIGKYRLEQVIGQGQFGQVRICRSIDTQQRFAIKIYSKAKIQNATNIRREISILQSLDHQNIVKLEDEFEDDKNIYLVQNYVSGLSLEQFVKGRTLSEMQVKVIMKQLAIAVQYLHSKNIAHRDIKLENILYGQQLQLIDFGFAVQTDKLCTIQCGTPNYMAPELLTKAPYKATPVDIYALGVLIHYLLTGEFYKNQIKISGPLYRILMNLLERNPEKRWTADRLLTELDLI